MLEVYKVCGQLLALALVHHCQLPVSLSMPIIKALLDQPCQLDDLEFTDETLHRSLTWLSQTNISDLDLGLTFTYVAPHGQERELIPNGSVIAVTESNKNEYISRVVKWLTDGQVARQQAALVTGFHEVLDQVYISIFTAQELQQLLQVGQEVKATCIILCKL